MHQRKAVEQLFEDEKIIIWDTEYTSWPGCQENGWDNEKEEYREIIQIGAVKFDTSRLEVLDGFDKAIRPQINPELSDYIKDLTGLSQKRIDEADKFETVLKAFIEWSQNLKLYSYGNDLDVVRRNIELYNPEIDLEQRRFKDMRKKFLENGVPVDNWNSGDIAHYFDPGKELLRQHDAYNDARNMAEAVKMMIRQNSSTPE